MLSLKLHGQWFPMNNYLTALSEVARVAPARLAEVFLKVALSRITVGVGPQTFFLYDLHNRPRRSWASYTRPDTLRVMMEINARDGDFLVAHDKLRTAEELREETIPCAEILAVVGRNTLKHPCNLSWTFLNNLQQVASFLDAPDCSRALFCKPARGLKGIGAILAKRKAAQWLVDSRLMTSIELANFLLDQQNEYGLLIQPQIVNHPDIQRLTGNGGLSTMRIVTAIIEGQAMIVAATQKLMGGDFLGDAFLNGMGGNLVAPVDMISGVLASAYGKSPGNRFMLERFATCPASGEGIEGFKVPMWEETLKVARAAALKLRREPLLGFDIAVTPEGPIVLEANPAASWVMHQITSQKGGKDMFGEVICRLDLPAAQRDRALAQMALV